MICLQLKQIALGSMLVLCFGIGLALTLVLTGIVAAAGARHLARRFAGLEHFADRVPWISGTLMLCVSAYMIMLGVNALRVAG
jgi:nickel/cobalt exporter